MKNKKLLMLVIITVLAAILLSGCANAIDKLEEQDVRADADDILNAIEAEDSDYIYNTYFNFLDRDEFDEGMKQVLNEYKGKRTETKFYSVYYQNFKGFGQNGKSSSSKFVTYIITTTESTYKLTMTYSKDVSTYKMVGFNISRDLDFVVNAGFRNYIAWNWILLILNIISYGVMIFALIVCIKTKVKRKWLWIILILNQVGVTIVKFPNTFNVNFSFIRLLGFSQYLEYAHGGTVTSVLIHVFAIIFLLLYKTLEKNYQNENEAEFNRITAEREEGARIEHTVKEENANKEKPGESQEEKLDS